MARRVPDDAVTATEQMYAAITDALIREVQHQGRQLRAGEIRHATAVAHLVEEWACDPVQAALLLDGWRGLTAKTRETT
jgi:hypothetical protein